MPSEPRYITASFVGRPAALRRGPKMIQQLLGDDASIQPTQKYLGLVRNGRKFAIVAATGDRFDIGFKLDHVGSVARHQPVDGVCSDDGRHSRSLIAVSRNSALNSSSEISRSVAKVAP